MRLQRLTATLPRSGCPFALVSGGEVDLRAAKERGTVSEESALSDQEWELVESAQSKLEDDDELTDAEEAALTKAVEAGEVSLEEESEEIEDGED